MGLGEAVLRKTMWLGALESQEEREAGASLEPQPRMQPRGLETEARTKVPQAAWEGRD